MLRSVVPQRPLPKDLEARLLAELNAAASASGTLRRVEESIAFILSTGAGSALGEEAGGTLLSVYVRDVLLVSEPLLSKVAQDEVRLWHLDALLRLLQNATALDPMESVVAKYRAPLTPDLEAELKAATPHLDLALLLSALRSFAVEHLREEFLNANEDMKLVLAEVQTDDGGDVGDLDWFRHFPDGVQMRHWVSVFSMLSGVGMHANEVTASESL